MRSTFQKSHSTISEVSDSDVSASTKSPGSDIGNWAAQQALAQGKHGRDAHGRTALLIKNDKDGNGQQPVIERRSQALKIFQQKLLN